MKKKSKKKAIKKIVKQTKLITRDEALHGALVLRAWILQDSKTDLDNLLKSIQTKSITHSSYQFSNAIRHLDKIEEIISFFSLDLGDRTS